MSVGIFTEKKHHPAECEILEALGRALPLWDELIAYILETYPCEEDFKFMYGKNYGWARRFRIKGQLLTSLFPAKDCFKAQVNLGPEAVDEALGMNLGSNVQQAIAGAIPYPEGRWLFIAVESAGDMQDIQRLLKLRVRTKRLVKS
jgi:hypothetical protein